MLRRKPRRDPVLAAVAREVFQRDGGCIAPRLGGSAMDCGGRDTLDHVKDEPMMGKRAPSDAAHLVVLCEAHHLWTGWATSHRPELRAYLTRANANPHEGHVDPCGLDCIARVPVQ